MGKLTKAQERVYLLSTLHEKVDSFASRLAPVYAFLQWKWGEKLPTKDQISKALRDLIRHITYDPKISYTGFGGLGVNATFNRASGWEVWAHFNDKITSYIDYE